MNIIISERYQKDISPDMVEKIAWVVENSLDLTGVEFSIVFEADSFVQTLNERYRKINEPTDVLSFGSDVVDPDTKTRYLGDVIISVPTVQKQAKERNIPFEDEICVVLVHGILHLAGMDHGSLEDKNAMWTVQEQILRSLNVNPTAIPQ